MIYVLIGLSLLFVAIGYMVTEKNAKYVLSGYNTMSTEEREQVNLKAYMSYFKKFHIFLGLSLFSIGYALTFVNENTAGIFLVIYPIIAYVYFAFTSSKFSGGLKTKSNRLSLIILTGTLVFVIGLLFYGFKADPILIHSDQIEFKGTYGETLQANDIKSIQLIETLPKIVLKTNGFALGDIKKGYFKTDTGEQVKLILNSDQKPYILFTKQDGKQIYFTAKNESNTHILNELKKEVPSVNYN